MAKKYSRVNWAAYPSKTTPMSAANLNVMDKGIDDLDNAVNALETSVSNITKDVSNISTQVTQLTDSQPTVLSGTLAAGETSISFTSEAITTDATFDFYTSIYGVSPVTAPIVTDGSITLEFDAQETDMNVKVRVM